MFRLAAPTPDSLKIIKITHEFYENNVESKVDRIINSKVKCLNR